MAGGRNHAAARGRFEDACVSLRGVRAGNAEAVDGNACDARRRDRPDAARRSAGGFASGVQAGRAG